MAKAAWIVLGVLGAIGLIVIGGVGAAIGTYNDLVNEREAADAQSKRVDVQYQRAFRLVPRLTDLAREFMENETDVITRATALRSALVEAQNGTFEAKDAYYQNLAQFVAIMGARAENYPQLRSQELYRTTMDEITNTENKIAMEKVRYNDGVERYNAHLKRCCMPLIVVGFAGFEAKEYIGYGDRPNQRAFPEGETI